MSRFLVLTAESLNDSHGTGVFVASLLHPHPRDRLFNLSRLPVTVPLPIPHLCLQKLKRHNKSRNSPPWRIPWRQLLRRGFNALHHGYQPLHFFKNTAALDDLLSATPSAVLACPVNEEDLDMLALVLESIPPHVPVVAYFMDWMPKNEPLMLRNLLVLSSRLSDVWCHSPKLASLLQSTLSRPVAVHDCVAIDLPAHNKTIHRPCRPGFRTLMSGNIWRAAIFPFLGEVWTRCRALLPDLDPLQWYCHPSRWENYSRHASLNNGFLQWAGFLPSTELATAWSAFDLAIVPLWPPGLGIDSYAAHSIPSRLALLAALGLPIIILAHPDSYTAGYCRRHGLGLVCSEPHPERAAQIIVDWIRHPHLLAETGARARAFALQHADITPLRRELHRTLRLDAG